MIENMEQLQALVRAGETDWAQYGDVRAVYHEGLVLFNYTQQAQYAGRWNWFEQQSRGLILNETTGEIVARPFPKFFNLGERQPAAGTRISTITEKWDGSLGILYRHNGAFKIATRGSFTGEQAVWATGYLNTLKLPPHLRKYDDLTLLFEIIYPENRIVVNYGDMRGLVLLGGRWNTVGDEIAYSGMEMLAEIMGIPYAKRYEFNTFEEIIAAAKALPTNEEGWVIRMSDGTRFKVKGDAYILAHRLLSEVTFKRVLDTVAAGTYHEMIEGVPDEFLTVVKGYYNEIMYKIGWVVDTCQELMLNAPQDSDRKTFALWVQQQPKHLHSYLFAMKDERKIVPIILKQAFKDRVERDLPAEATE
jgi:RNA ligase